MALSQTVERAGDSEWRYVIYDDAHPFHNLSGELTAVEHGEPCPTHEQADAAGVLRLQALTNARK